MNIYEISGRHLELSPAMRSYVTEKLEQLEPLSADVVDAKVVMSYSGSGTIDKPNKVEVQLNLPHTIIRAEVRSRDAYLAIDSVVEKLERQLKRHQERKLSKRKEKNIDLPIVEDSAENEFLSPTGIARVKKHTLRPMSPEDAVFQMEFSGHSFYMFRNAKDDEINVVYLRHDGSYGLLQPN